MVPLLHQAYFTAVLDANMYHSDVPKATARSIRFYSKLRLQPKEPGLGITFWNNLTTFVAAVIAHATDLAELHRRRFRYENRGNKNLSLPNEVAVPSLFVKLSDVLPTAGEQSDHSLLPDEKHQPLPPSNTDSLKDGSLPPASNMNEAFETRRVESPRRPTGARKPWAADFVEIRYSGVQSIPGGNSTSARQLTCGQDAVVRVLDKKKFALLTGKLGHDVFYNAHRGEFCVRLRTSVGASVVQTLKTRLQAIDRVVDSLDAMRVAKGAIKCEQVTLEKVVFTYTDTGAAEGAKRWRVSLDLSKDSIVLGLENGNPHLRVLDHLTSLVNAPRGISNLILVLPMSLTILTVLDKIQNTWKDLAKNDKGALVITAKSLDWITLCYELPETPNRPRSVRIDVRARTRNGKLWWFVNRADQEDQDYFAQKLRKVWEARNVPWRSLSSGAATQIDDRSLNLLLGLDQTVREAVIGSPAGGSGGAQTTAGKANVLTGGSSTASATAAVGSRAKPVTLD